MRCRYTVRLQKRRNHVVVAAVAPPCRGGCDRRRYFYHYSLVLEPQRRTVVGEEEQLEKQTMRRPFPRRCRRISSTSNAEAMVATAMAIIVGITTATWVLVQVEQAIMVV